MSNQVDAHGLTEFLQRLGRCYWHQGVVYLAGGSSLLLMNAKDSTFDIDIKIDVAPEHHAEFIRCVRQLSRELGLPVDQASPDQFIPLPGGYQDRRQFVGRFGELDVFHFDFYSVALSKIHRGSEKDYADVTGMIRQGIVEWSLLVTFFEEIMPEYEVHLTADPQDFRRKFALLGKKLQSDAETTS